MPIRKFVVTLNTEMSEADTKEFILDAVSTWGGQYFPGDEDRPPDPRFEINREDVTVKRAVKSKK